MASKKGLFVLVLLLVQLIGPLAFQVPVVRAQAGSVTASDVFISVGQDYFKNSNVSGPWATGAGVSVSNDALGIGYIDLPGKTPADWSFNVQALNITVYNAISGANWPVQGVVYTGTVAGDGAVLLDDTLEFFLPDEVGGVGTYHYGPYDMVTVPDITGQDGLWIGVWGDDKGGTVMLWSFAGGVAGPSVTPQSKIYAYTPSEPAPPSPLSGLSAYAFGQNYPGISINLRGSILNASTVNQYYGSLAGDFEAVRQYGLDVTDSRLSSVNASLLIPWEESLVNVTYWTGATWALVPGSVYEELAYNSTFRQVLIQEDDIAIYGTQFQVWTEDPVSSYWFSGLYYENGTKKGSVTVTAYLASGSAQFVVDGLDNPWSFAESPISFSWAITGGGSRTHYPQENNESILLTDPGASSYVYAFDIVDYTGMIGYSDSYLKSQRIINGSQVQVQVMLILSTAQDVPMTLEYGQAYTISVILTDSVQSFGFFVAQDDFNPTLILRPQGFSSGVYQSQRYLLFEGSRSVDGVTIQGDYNDTGLATTTIIFQVRYLNNTVVYSSSINANQTTFQYLSANNETDYYVWMRAITPPAYFGNITYQKALPRVPSTMPFLNLTGLGTLPPNSAGQDAPEGLLPMGLTLAMVGTLSVWSAPMGLVVTLLTGGIMHRWGWWDLDMTLWTSALCFAVVFIIVSAKRYSGGPG